LFAATTNLNKGIIFLIVALHCKDWFAWATCTDTHFDHLAVKEVGEVLLIDIDVMLPMYKRRDCLDKFRLLPMPIPNVWMGIGGGRPGIPRIGGI